MKTKKVSYQLSVLVGSFFLSWIIAASGFWFLNQKFESAIKELLNHDVPSVRAAGEIDVYHDGLRGVIFNAVYLREKGLEKNSADFNQLSFEVQEFEQGFVKNISLIEKILKETELATAVLPFLNQARAEVDIYVKSARAVLEKGNSHLPEFIGEFEKLEERLEALSGEMEKLSNKKEESMNRELSQAKSILGFFSGAILLLNLFLAYYFSKNISWSVYHVSKSLSQQLASLKAMATKVLKAGHGLSSSSAQQASFVAETASSMEELTSMVAQTAQNAQSSFEISDQTQKKAAEGREVVTKLSESMREIGENNFKLESISKLIEQIKSKTKIINDIVAETRLLSFNASIEAARAGVHGKGFSVVAEEVGKLASVSGKAAEEIRKLLDTSTQDVKKVISETQDRVEQAQRAAKKCEAAFDEMESSVTHLMESSRLISSATREQSAGISQASKAISEMDQGAQSTSAVADELAQAAGTLSNDVVNRIEELSGLLKALSGDADFREESTGEPQAYLAGVNKNASMTKKTGKKPKMVLTKKEPKVALAGASPSAKGETSRDEFLKPENTSEHGVKVINILTQKEEPLGKDELDSAVGRSDSRWRAS